MSKAIENLEAAQKRALAIRPKVGGFPYLAETLRRAGVTRNVWFLPGCQSLFLTNDGPVMTQGDRHWRPALSTYPPSTARADLCFANGSGRRKHVPGIPGGFVESRCRPL